MRINLMYALLDKNKLIVFSLFCIVFAIFEALVPSSIIVFYFNAVIGVLLTLYIYMYYIYNRKNIFDPYLILSFSIGFGYVLSTLIYLINNRIRRLEDIVNNQNIFIDPSSYGYALSLIIIVVAGISIFSTFSRGIYVYDITSESINWKLRLFLHGSIFFTLFCFMTGIIGYRGTELEENGGLNPLAALVLILLPIQSLFFLLLSIKNKFYLLYLAVTIILISLGGRRNIFYLFLMFPIVFVTIGYTINFKWFYKKIHYVILAFSSFLALSYFFIAVRVALNQGNVFSTFQIFSTGYYYALNNSDDIFLYLEDTTSNRSFIINYFALLINNYNFQKMPIYGDEFYYSFLNNIPSVIFNKAGYIPDSMEVYTHPFYGIPIEDSANSILVSGLNDFYIIGVFLYPILICSFSILYFRLLNKIKNNFNKVVCVCFLTYNLLQVEIALDGLLGIYRSILIVIIIYFIYGSLFDVFVKRFKL